MKDNKKAKVIRALSEQWIVAVPEGTYLYASPVSPVAAERDAARYRWLRQYAPRTILREVFDVDSDRSGENSAQVDEAVDAAMKEPK